MGNSPKTEKGLQSTEERVSTFDHASYTTAENGLKEKDLAHTREFDVYGDEDTAESTSSS